MEWTKAMTTKLIELWQTKPCLWQIKNPEYRNKNKKRQALAELSEEMEIPVSAIEKRFVSLKTQYSRALYRHKAKNDMGLEDDSGWYAFEYLHFLRDISLNSTLKSDTSDSPNDMMDDSKDNLKTSFSPDDVQCTHDEFITHDTWPDPQPLVKRTKVERHEVNCFRGSKKSPETKDEFSAFGDLVAAELRSELDEKNRLLLKKEITEVIYNFKLKTLANI